MQDLRIAPRPDVLVRATDMITERGAVAARRRRFGHRNRTPAVAHATRQGLT